MVLEALLFDDRFEDELAKVDWQPASTSEALPTTKAIDVNLLVGYR